MKNNGGVSWSPIMGQGNFHKATRFGKVQWGACAGRWPAAGDGCAAERCVGTRSDECRACGTTSARMGRPVMPADAAVAIKTASGMGVAICRQSFQICHSTIRR